MEHLGDPWIIYTITMSNIRGIGDHNIQIWYN